MSTDQKANKLKSNSGWGYSIIKISLLIIIASLLMFFIAHLAVSYGIQMDEVGSFFKRTWLIWLVIRFLLYVSLIIFIYRISQKQPNLIEKKSLTRLYVSVFIFISVIELINFTRL